MAHLGGVYESTGRPAEARRLYLEVAENWPRLKQPSESAKWIALAEKLPLGSDEQPHEMVATGWITDEHCGAKGAKAGHEKCAEKCFKEGSKAVFFNNADKKIYKLDNQDLAMQHGGHKVRISGRVTGNSIAINSIEMVGDSKESGI